MAAFVGAQSLQNLKPVLTTMVIGYPENLYRVVIPGIRNQYFINTKSRGYPRKYLAKVNLG